MFSETTVIVSSTAIGYLIGTVMTLIAVIVGHKITSRNDSNDNLFFKDKEPEVYAQAGEIVTDEDPEPDVYDRAGT